MATLRTVSGERDTLISVSQAAALLGVHANTIRAWTEAGRLTAWRINARGDRRYRRSDVEAVLAPDLDGATDSQLGTEVGAAELASIAQVTTGTVGISSVNAVCRVAIDSLRELGDLTRVAIYLNRDGAPVLEAHAGYRIAPPPTLTDEPYPPGVSRLSLRGADDELGVLVVEDDDQGATIERRRPFLEALAGTVGVALHHARLLSRARRELTRARALRKVTQELTGQLELDEVLDDIVDRTRSLFDADKVGLWMVTDNTHPFQLAASRDIGDEFAAAVSAMTMDTPSLGVSAVLERQTMVARQSEFKSSVGAMHEVYLAEGLRSVCLVPLVAHERVVGLLGVYHLRDREWPDDELALVQAFANQAAVAINNARLYRSLADQAARMRSIHDLSDRLNRLTNVQAIADAIVAEASTLADYHDIRVYTVDWENRVCEPVSFTDRLLGEGDFRERLRVDIGEGSFTGWVAEHAEPILSNDALTDTRGHTIEGTDEIEESMLVVPMVYEGRSVGVIALSKLGIDQFTADDMQTMTIFAGYAAQALINARSYRRLEEQSAQLARQLESQRKLLEVNEQVMGTLEQSDIFEVIADGLKAVVHYDNLSIYRADHTKGILVPVLTRERHAEEVARYIIPFGRGLMGWAVDHGEAVLANDALHDPRALQIPGTPPDPEALVVVPLISDGRVTGSMNVSRIGGEGIYFSETEFELVKLFAAQASVALRNADAHHLVSVQAETDALTGLGNHGAFQRDLALALQARPASDGTQRVTLLMMDLDQFKRYNDRLGHPAGDALLHAVGTAITAALRSHDPVYRYGGDEFAVILPGATTAEGRHVADRIRRNVARLTARGDGPVVTISVGVATWPGDAGDKDGLISAADRALYRGKQSGEDRVVLAASPGPHSAPAPTPVSALLSLTRALDQTDPSGQTGRVARLSTRIAEELAEADFDPATAELVARLRELDPGVVASLPGAAEPAAVAAAVGWLRRPRTRRPGPLAAQIVCVALAYDEAQVALGPRGDRATVLAEARERVGRRVEPDVTAALARVVADRPPTGGRRRRQDTPRRRASAA